MLTVVFGLWHGLIMLPVTLSIIGPKNTAYETEPSSTHQISSIGSSTASLPPSEDGLTPSPVRGHSVAAAKVEGGLSRAGQHTKTGEGEFNVTFTNAGVTFSLLKTKISQHISLLFFYCMAGGCIEQILRFNTVYEA